MDRAAIDTNLVLALTLMDHPGANLRVDLLDDAGTPLPQDLGGNLIDGDALRKERHLVLPLHDLPLATRIRLRRVTGDISIYTLALAIDNDPMSIPIVGAVTREVWHDIPDIQVYMLTEDSDYPDQPDLVEERPALEGPVN